MFTEYNISRGEDEKADHTNQRITNKHSRKNSEHTLVTTNSYLN